MTTKIASVHFYPLACDRPLYNGMYRIPAVGIDEQPVIYEIEDKLESSWEPVEGMNRRQLKKVLIHCDDIARDLLQTWTGGRLGCGPTCHPGVWIVRESEPRLNPDGTVQLTLEGKAVFDPLSDERRRQYFAEDLANARACDANYAMYLINDATGTVAQDPRKAPFITALTRAAAKAYKPDVEWLRGGLSLQMKSCQFCSTPILQTVAVCPKCNNVVNAALYGTLKVQTDEAVRVSKGEQTKVIRERMEAEKAAAKLSAQKPVEELEEAEVA